jgi:hypothetical protein
VKTKKPLGGGGARAEYNSVGLKEARRRNKGFSTEMDMKWLETAMSAVHPNWTWAEIEAEWLIGGRVAVSPEEVVTAFNKAEEVLGREWIEAIGSLHAGSPLRGTSPTLHVVTVGQHLASIDGASGVAELIGKLRANDASAFAELTAAHLVRSRHPDFDLEFAPEVQVGIGGRSRKPDFRIRRGNEQWIYIEVTRPDIAEAEEKARVILSRLASHVTLIERSFALEVFLRREPTGEEIDRLEALIPNYCLSDEAKRYDLPELAILSLNLSPTNMVIPIDHPDEPTVPRLGCARVMVGPGNTHHRHISVRMAYADDRAESVLRKEAKQLPTDAPSLVMIEMSRAPGGILTWEPILRRRLQPNIHTRVSAVCLFGGGQKLEPGGGDSISYEVKLIENPHASRPLPAWIMDTL